MENSSIDGGIEPVNTESKVPLILAIAAFVLGGLSFVFAFNTKSNLERLKGNMQKEVTEAVEAAKQAAADARSVGSGNEGFATLKTDFAELEAKVKAGYNDIAASQKQIVSNAVELNRRLAALEGNRGGAPVAATPAGGNNARPAAPATGTTAPAGGKYTVKQGDYPAKIAKELGVSTKALMDANPGLDPKKLQIGQKLNVPEKK